MSDTSARPVTFPYTGAKWQAHLLRIGHANKGKRKPYLQHYKKRKPEPEPPELDCDAEHPIDEPLSFDGYDPKPTPGGCGL